MKNLLLSLGLVLVSTVAQAESFTTAAAISALYVAGDDAQRAVTTVVCEDKPEPTMSAEATRQANHVLAALQAAYDASSGTDSAVEEVLNDFCLGASER